MAKILLAEDDPNLGFMVKDNLQDRGHEVYWASDGQEALRVFKEWKAELAIVDVMMPNVDGFELVNEIRKTDQNLPIIFLTARSQEEDRLKGFAIGADDYVTKPFSIKELDYRVNVFLRRAEVLTTTSPDKIPIGAFSFDVKNMVLQREGLAINLTQMESKLLHLLLQNKNQVVTREAILEEIWGENDYFKGRSLDVFITRLRKYLKEDQQLQIKNNHGVGFMLVEDTSPA